jgi:TIR domain-containing protein
VPPSQDDVLSFKAFLSHRYKSPAVNRYFFGIFADAAEVQFEVDEGAFAINVTRLERMIRDCDAFIGIYPFPGDDPVPERGNLLRESQYFRLELDLAIRARKPGLILYDRRYRQLFRCPPSISALDFDSLEVESPGGSPSRGVFERAFRTFCERVKEWKDYDITGRAAGEQNTGVVLALPLRGRGADGYSRSEIDVVRGQLDSAGYDDVSDLRWPPVLDGETLTLLRQADWAVADVGYAGPASGAVAYLHGSFVPTMRLLRTARDSAGAAPLDFLYQGVEVGYAEDVVPWSTRRSLEEGLRRRLSSLNYPVRRISTTKEADDYFRSASLRKDAVFLSYSGKDKPVAAGLGSALREKFQNVFDYQDGRSIRPGQPWLQEIFTQLSASAIGVPLLSASYVASGNCEHELREMVAKHDSRSMELFPIVLEADVEIPAYLRDTQYVLYSQSGSPGEVVEAILSDLP